MPKPKLSYANPFENNSSTALLDPGKLFSDYGHDVRGDNSIATMLGVSGMQLYPRVASQIGFGNQLEGQKQETILNYLKMLRPENRQAEVDRMREKGYNAATSQAAQTDFTMRQLGLGEGARAGAVQSGFNQANMAANQMQNYNGSAQGQQDTLKLILQLISGGQTSDLDQLLALFGPMEANSQNRQANLGSGSFLGQVGGMLGSVAGGMDWTKLLGGRGSKAQLMAGGAQYA